MQIFAKKNKGFTLIELLVVIAIIGILASIVLVALGGARAKARDSRIISDMNQIRNLAEIVVDDDQNYNRVDCAEDDPAFDDLCGDINTQNGTAGGAPTVYKPVAPSGSYCVVATLNSTSQYFCVDSTLVAKQYSAAPCGAADFTCD